MTTHFCHLPHLLCDRILPFQGAVFGGGGNTTGSGLPFCLMWAFCHMARDFLTYWAGSCPFGSSWLLRVRNAGHHSRVGMLKGSAMCPWMQGSRSCVWQGGSWPGQNLAGSRDCQCRVRPGGAWTERHAKPSLRVCSTPKLVVFEHVIYPNKERQCFCWPSQIPSLVHRLAGWLTWYLNWKHKGIPLKWSILVGLLGALESMFGRQLSTHVCR